MAHGERVLLVEEDGVLRRLCSDALAGEGYHVRQARDATMARRLLEAEPFSIGVVDLVLPDAHGMDIVRDMKAADADSCVIVITEFASLDSATEAIRAGAYDYLRKPIEMIDLVRVVNRAGEAVELQRRNRELHESLAQANAELRQHQRQRRQELETAVGQMRQLIELGKRLQSAASPKRMLSDILDAAVTLVGVASGAVLAHDAKKRRFAVLLARGLRTAGIESATVPAHTGLLGAMRQAREVIVENDLLVSPRIDDGYLRDLGASSALVAPALLGGVLHGSLLLLNKREGDFTTTDASIGSALACEAAAALAQLTSSVRPQHPGGENFVSMQDLTQ